MKTNTIICGAMPEATKVFPDGYFNCSISSPPYWALRDYGVDGQLGLEPTFEEYIDKLCTIYDEVKRILRDDGCCFVNMGDTYAGGIGTNLSAQSKKYEVGDGLRHPNGHPQQNGTPAKSLCLIPQRFAIEMVNRGWILRNVIIWHKPNPMPSSAKDRFTVDFEYVYFFTKQRKYWFEPQYEAHHPDGRKKTFGGGAPKYEEFNSFQTADHERWANPLGRNKRTVWTIPTQPYPEAHFATFPEKLVEPMIKAGCPEFVCTKCGKAREKIYDREVVHNRPNTRPDANVRPDNYERIPSDWKPKESKCLGYTDCGCNADWRPGIVLDCFCRQWHDFTGSRKAAA